MNKFKSGLLLLTAVVFGSALFAQNIEDGKKFFFEGRLTSAKNLFSQLVSANAGNTDAVYWLGETDIELEDVAGAKTLFQNTLMANPNSPLLLVGIGHVELLEGQTQDARQRFETAISLTQAKNISVLNAVGYANVDASSGDADYAIDKLKQASTLKGMKDPDVFINLGDAYRKLLDGGSAQAAYESALALNPNYARASYKIGKIYQTQGPSQEDVFMKYYNDAIAKDPAFTAVYYQLYDYYFYHDLNKSKDYLDKYIANADPDPKNCFYQASLIYASGQFQQTITKSDECIAANSATPYPNLFGLKAYAYDKMGDSVNAKAFFEQYFAKQKPEKIGPNDYATYAKDLLKFPGNDTVAASYVEKAIVLDTTESDKVNEAKAMADYYTQVKNPNEAGRWYKRIISLKKTPAKADYQNAGYSYYRAGNFTASSAIFDSAIHLFPDDIYCEYMMAKSQWGIDSTGSLGLANPYFQKVVDMGEAAPEKDKVKAQLIPSYKYFVGYYVNVKRDKPTALAYCDKYLAVDSLDTDAKAYKEAINKMNTKPTAPAKSGNTKSPAALKKN